MLGWIVMAVFGVLYMLASISAPKTKRRKKKSKSQTAKLVSLARKIDRKF